MLRLSENDNRKKVIEWIYSNQVIRQPHENGWLFSTCTVTRCLLLTGALDSWTLWLSCRTVPGPAICRGVAGVCGLVTVYLVEQSKFVDYKGIPAPVNVYDTGHLAMTYAALLSLRLVGVFTMILV